MSLAYSASFNGSNYLQISNYTGNPAAFSYSAFLNLFIAQTSRAYFANFQITGSKGSAAGIHSVSDVLKFYVATTNLASATTLTLGTWYHVVMTYDGTTAKIYLNGNSTPDASQAIAISYGSVPTNNYIGAEPNLPQNYIGLIAGMGVWHKALSTTEIATLYNGGLGLSGPELSGTLLTSIDSYHDFTNSASLGTDTSGGGHTYTNTGSVTQSIGPDFNTLLSLGTQPKPNQPILRPAWATNLIAAYALNEGSSTAADLSGNSHTGTLTGSCTWTSGTYGNQLSFADNGTTGSYLALATNLTALNNVTAFTYSALCKLDTYADAPRAGGFRMLMGTNRAGAGYPQCTIFYRSTNKSINFNARYNNYPDLIAPVFPLNQWVLVTGQISSNVQSLWYDGVKVATQAVASYAFANDLAPTGALGDELALQTGNNWSGIISMALYATRGYTDAEILALSVDPFVWARQPFTGAPLLPAM